MNKIFVKRLVARFGASGKPFKVKMRYTKEVLAFLRKIEEAHQQAAKSKLVFG